LSVLTTKHEDVALAYIADPEKNGARAYRSVYPKSSISASKVAFSRLLTDDNFAARIANLMSEVTKCTILSAQQVLEGLSRLASSNMQDYVGDHGQVLGVEQLTREHAGAIHEITVEHYIEGKGDDATPVTRTKIKLYDKRAALVDLGRHYKLFTDRKEIDVGETLEKLIAQSMK
jgi:phage terminase small subunit